MTESNTPHSSQQATALRATPVRLEAALARMNGDQIRFVLRRLAPASRSTRKADMTRDVIAALESPEHVDAALMGLTPFEIAMLQELKRYGGTANGLALAAFAALHGHVAPPHTFRPGSFQWRYARVGASDYLSDLIDGGVLLPLSGNSEWFEYGRGEGRHNLVSADARLLARVSNPPLTPPAPLDLPEAPSGGASAQHPVAVVLRLHGVLQLVGTEGGVRVTKKNEIAKAFLTRLERAAPELAADLWWTLPLLQHLSLVSPPAESAGNVWRLNNEAVNALRRQPLLVQYARIVDAYALMSFPQFEEAWRYDWRIRINDTSAVWRATLEAIAILPAHPVALEAAAHGIWNAALSHVFGDSRSLKATRAPDPADRAVPAALGALLAGPFASVGLLAVTDAPHHAPNQTTYQGTVDAEPAPKVIQKAEGWRWYSLAWNAALGREYLPEDTSTGQDVPGGDRHDASALGHSLLIQPNFEVLAYLDRLDDEAILALACAAVTRIDARTATFTIDRRSFEQALDTGGSLQGILAALAARSPGVPENVETSLRDWASRRERLTLRPAVNLVEYHSRAARDLGARTLNGARPVGERFLMLPTRQVAPPVTVERDYRQPHPVALKFRPDGHVHVKGQPDLAVRAALSKVTKPASKDQLRLDPEAIRSGSLTAAVRTVLMGAAETGFPPELDALLRAWAGSTPQPTVAPASLFRHPDAALLAGFKHVGAALDAKLSPSTYLVKRGKEADLEAALRNLGLDVGNELAVESEALQSVGEGDLLRGLSTRKMRELLEAAVVAGHNVELEYAAELEHWTRHGSYRRSRGKVRKELVRPEAVIYEGSIPYLLGYTVARGTERTVRIGYIDAVAVRAGGR